MQTIKEYAFEHQITYEAVRKQIKRYSAELEGHIVQVGKTRMLDDVAIKILDSKRLLNPVAAYNEVRAMEDHNKDVALMNVQAELIAANKENARLKELLAQAEQDKLLLESKDAQIGSLTATINTQSSEIDTLKEQIATKNERLDATEQQLEEATTKNMVLSASYDKELEAKEAAEKRAEEAEVKLKKLQNRGFFARLFNKDE